jgi:hypothetical protein
MSALQFGVHAPERNAQALAREILTQPRFRVQVPHATVRTWWDALRDWAGDRWNQLIDAFSHHVKFGANASVAAGDVLLVILIGLVILVLVRLLLGVAREGEIPGAAAVSALSPRPNPSVLHTAAQQAVQLGAYASAIALLYRAALAVLDARGVLRDDPARTVNECRRDVRRQAPHLSVPFERIARAFTAAVYAEDRVTAEHWNDAHAAYAQMTAVQADAA